MVVERGGEEMTNRYMEHASTVYARPKGSARTWVAAATHPSYDAAKSAMASMSYPTNRYEFRVEVGNRPYIVV